MLLKGFCRCKAARLTVRSHAPVPCTPCRRSICRRIASASGGATDIAAGADSGNATLRASLAAHRGGLSRSAHTRFPGRRHFRVLG